ncbi:FAD/NAD(P)-binding domain-containing protein [Rhizodiscina lignyota]|uniref:FAD/NAD(P)-binding domain-containing protein n=1 Tax=Rhizodiscina lignyota TaxID=1504668 RepID=A0A9P4IQ56_9PEZI|nr:FAD/NAD(P)-binding domain-containing protein [Rhizodiscina lignyota]
MGSLGDDIIPESSSVLVIGGGPGGSFAATLLAREGIDVVVLEAAEFPRYHIGESLLPSARFYLRHIGLEERFNVAGFAEKHGASFKLSPKAEAYTNFSAINGRENHAWNVLRSKADDIMLKYSAECGAKVFEGTRVSSIEFVQADEDMIDPDDSRVANPGRPVSAKWTRKDGRTGTISFEYLVDASGREGLVSTKYLKNRQFNQSLKNVATWSYWKCAKRYAPGTEREGQPFFEGLADQTGWCWAIPLSAETLSVGFVMNQKLLAQKKVAMVDATVVEFYKKTLDQVPIIKDLLADAVMEGGVRSASDYSYRASAFSAPYTRLVGDAGSFIDPYFSSGVHLAMTGAFSAAITIQASRRGECSELQAGKWHSSKVATGYTRFLIMVLVAMKQLNNQNEPVLSDWSEDGFDKAFDFFRPIIQGTADSYNTGRKLTQGEIDKTLEFLMTHYNQNLEPEQRQSVLNKLGKIKQQSRDTVEDLKQLSEGEYKVLEIIRAREMLPIGEVVGLSDVSQDIYDGYHARIDRGNLGLSRVGGSSGKNEQKDSFGTILGKEQMQAEQQSLS